MIKDLQKEFPDAKLAQEQSAVDALIDIYINDCSVRFIFVLDEWDFIFHQPFITEKEKMAYFSFLKSLLKDRPYILLVYMTGIQPIAKYSNGSELNMFTEFTMAKALAFSDYFGFTQAEVDDLYLRYQNNCKDMRITRIGLQQWHNGYHTASGEQVYDPCSVVQALRFNELSNY